MPLIVDTNCLANVFEKKSAKHDEFWPVLNWILNGKGLLIYGGSKYMNELKKTPKYLPIIRYLTEIGKAVKGDEKKIDKYEERNKKLITDPDFDDPHLAAIVLDTRCRIICSEDKRSVRFIQNPILYPSRFTCPSYYVGKRNVDLLTDKYIDNKLKPLCTIPKEKRDRLSKIMDNL
jgi:hypothetical protein